MIWRLGSRGVTGPVLNHPVMAMPPESYRMTPKVLPHTSLSQVRLGHRLTGGGKGLGQLKKQLRSTELWVLLLLFPLRQGAGRR